MSEQNKIESQFVYYETAKMLKQLGFDEPCFKYYNILENLIDVFNFNSNPNNIGNSCSAPLWQQAEQWLWEKHKTWFKVHAVGNDSSFVNIYSKDHFVETLDGFSSPITAKTEGIKQAIKHLHSNSKK